MLMTSSTDSGSNKELHSSVCVMQTGSWFELANKNAIFGVLGPENPLWSIILGFFGVSGYPTAGERPAAVKRDLLS